MFHSWSESNGKDKLSDFVERYWHFDNITAMTKDEQDIPSSVIVNLAKALHTTPNYLLMGESDEDSWTEDILNILEKTDPAMRALAMKQLKCIAEL